ncbi:MAG: TIR domain-containing protein [Anaerolineae bacterium]|nr:MAG: TIR domain-containing protein [Anaerolineae bacterium]
MPKARLFISYKTGRDDGLTGDAQDLRRRLMQDDYDVWLDTENLAGGERWDEQIFEAIPVRDMVLLLLSEPAAESAWVRREIEIAKRTHVYVIPVLIRGSFDVNQVLSKLALPNVQYVDYRESKDHQYRTLVEQIERNKHKTLEARDQLLIGLGRLNEQKPEVRTKFSPDDQEHRVYGLPEVPLEQLTVYLAAGDMTRMSGIDVLVNSENSYMQMARVFETSSLSSNLRWRGSWVERGRFKEDTVQLELYDQLMSENYNIPVATGHVIPTHAGHDKSELVKENDARYIFHVAMVQVDPKQSLKMISADNSGIEDGVRNCFREVIRVNGEKGLISPVGRPRRDQEEAQKDHYKNIESIIFPLFATGQGGRTSEILDIAELMVKTFIGCYKSYKNRKNFTLKRIYLCAFSQQDVQIVEEVMNRSLTPKG